MIGPPRILLASIATFVLIFTGCSKKETMEVDNETQSVVDYAIADQEFMGLISAASNGALTFTASGVTNYTYVPGPPVMPDGKERTGFVAVRINGQSKTPGTQMVFKFFNYNASGISYSCDSVLVTTEEWSTERARFSVKLINGLCQTSNYSIKYKFDRSFTIFPGEEGLYAGVICHVYGTASGTNRANRNFSTNVPQASPLVKQANCAYISAGAMELTPEGFKSRTINFGNGECDDQATFTVKENTVAFKLK